MILFPSPLQLPEVVGVAQGVDDALVAVVRLPVIVTQHPLEHGQDSDLIHGLGTALGMGMEPSQ